MTEKVKYKSKGAEHDDVVNTGDAHEKRPADKKNVGDIKPMSVKEGLMEIFGGVEGLSEDFISKSEVLFEAKISEKIEEILPNIVESIQDDMIDKIDGYLDLFVENYLEQNQVAIETGFRNEIASQVMESISNIVESCGLTIPEEQVNIAEALLEENEVLQEQFNNLYNENIELNEILIAKEKQSIVAEEAKNLSEAAQYKLFSLMENIESSNKDEFIEKLQIIKESLVEKTKGSEKLTEEFEDSSEENKKQIDPKMAAYIRIAQGSYYS